MKDAKLFLELCHKKFVSTRSHQRHNLTIEDGVLVLTLMLGDTCQRFNFSEEDMNRGPLELVADITKLLKKAKPGSKPDDTVA